MSEFNSHVEKIIAEVRNKDQFRTEYSEEYDLIIDYILNNLCEDPDFRMIFRGIDLFGSITALDWVIEPYDTDVMLVLCIPDDKGVVKVALNKDCPSFVTLDYSKLLQESRASNAPILELMERLVNPKTEYLDKVRLEEWIDSLFKGVFTDRPEVEGAKGNKWLLQYWKTDDAFTVKASEGGKEVTIDFSIGIKLYGNTWPYCKTKGIFKTKLDYWYACWKRSANLDPNMEASVFQVVNPRAETLKLLDHCKLKQVYRLLKIFRKKNELFKIQNYYLTTLFLLEIDSQDDDFWKQHIGIIFKHMLKKLSQVFESGYLPYYWHDEMNLLKNLLNYHITNYGEILNKSCKTFENDSSERGLTFEECRSFFLEE